jgi:hypothetical protein
MLARVIAFPAHRLKRRPSVAVFASLADLEAQRRDAMRLFGLCAAVSLVLTAVACLVAG